MPAPWVVNPPPSDRLGNLDGEAAVIEPLIVGRAYWRPCCSMCGQGSAMRRIGLSPATIPLYAFSVASVVFATGVVSGGRCEAAEYSIRFFGNGVAAPDLDRVKISIDAPHKPVDVGTGDFTIEWWMKN